MENDLINLIAAELAKAGIRVSIENDGICLNANKEIIESNIDFIHFVLDRHGNELEAFYKKRLDVEIA